VVATPAAGAFRSAAGRVEERSLVPLGEACIGRIGLDEWFRRSEGKSLIPHPPTEG
jgi:hypothetical protein